MASKSSPAHSQSGSPPPPPVDLRHMTSNSVLASPTRDQRSSNRTSQHLRTGDPRVGSKSPGSIPSSPTSIHSSSSAIFERDIEPIVPPSPPVFLSHGHHHPHHPPNPHRIPRAKGTEALEQSVPSVLDSAAAILSTLETDAGDVADQVAVVAPASSPLDSTHIGRSGSGFTSPIGSFRSRSPSPIGSRTGGGRGAELLLNIPTSGGQPQPLSSAMSSPPISALGLHGVTSGVTSPTSGYGPSSTSASLPPSKHQVIQSADTALQPATITQVFGGSNTGPDESSATSATAPSIVTPSMEREGAVSITSASEDPEPLTTTQEYPPALPTVQPSPRHSPSSIPLSLPLPPPSLASPRSISSTTSPISSPSSTHITLSSHPPSPVHTAKKRLSFMSYSDLLSSTPASLQPLSSLTTCASSIEPPPHIPSVSGLNLVNAIQAHQQSQAQSPQSGPGSATPSLRGFPLALGLTGGVTHAGKRDSIAMLDNVGGEWERQGLGKGLEERLDALVIPPSGGVALSPVTPVVHAQSVVGSKA